MVPAGYFLLVIFSNYFTVKRGNLAYFSSFLSLLKSNLKKSLIGSTQLGPFWIAIMNLYIKSFQKIYIFWECLIFCLNQTLAGCAITCDSVLIWITNLPRKIYSYAKSTKSREYIKVRLSTTHLFEIPALYLA